MGRKKIKIAPISDDRNRSVTFLKRKAGLMKKAHELAVLTGSEVAVIVFSQQGKMSEFCSGDMDHVLLRYTEHTGPAERRGPEFYQDDDDEDEEGDDNDDERNDNDGAGGGGDDDPGGSTETSSRGKGNGRSGASSGPLGNTSNEAAPSARSQKRKAPGGVKREHDAQSVSSASSSRRDSSPSTTALGMTSGVANGAGPVIMVEDSNSSEKSTDPSGGLDRGTLKAAILQRSLSKSGSENDVLSQMSTTQSGRSRPPNMQHHHSFSSGDYSLLQHGGAAAAAAAGAMHGEALLPQRPSTAGAIGTLPSVASPYGTSQQASSSRFAFTPDPTASSPHHPSHQRTMQVGPLHGYLSPQPAFYSPISPPLTQPGFQSQSMMSMPRHETYGELARGGHGGPLLGAQSTLTVPGQQPMGIAYNVDSSLSPDARSNSRSGLGSLVNSIPRQHQHLESYTPQFRAQQQRNASAPMIHTAPSSPSYLMHDSTPAASINENLLSPMPGGMTVKRSASFGMASADHLGRQQHISATSNIPSLDQNGRVGTLGSTPSIAALNGSNIRHGHDVSMHDYHRSLHSAPPPHNLALNGESASRSVEGDGSVAAPVVGQQPISNAAFNDLMGSNAAFNDLMSSIVQNLEPSSENVGTNGGPTFSTSLPDTKSKLTDAPHSKLSIKEQQDDVMRSMDSQHSLSTLVNSESFEALVGGSDSEGVAAKSSIMAINGDAQQAGHAQKSNESESNSGYASTLAPAAVHPADDTTE